MASCQIQEIKDPESRPTSSNHSRSSKLKLFNHPFNSKLTWLSAKLKCVLHLINRGVTCEVIWMEDEWCYITIILYISLGNTGTARCLKGGGGKWATLRSTAIFLPCMSHQLLVFGKTLSVHPLVEFPSLFYFLKYFLDKNILK